jgi:hypothetical protein
MAPMTARPISLILAAGLLILIGLSGLAAGSLLLAAAKSGPEVANDVKFAALALGTAIGSYGFAAAIAGVGLVLLRRWAWRLGLATVIIGLVLLAVAIVAAGPDQALALGLAIWGATLACVAARGTRDAVVGPVKP